MLHPFWKIFQSPQSWIHKVNYFSGSNPNLIKFFDCFSEYNREFSIWNSNNSKSVEKCHPQTFLCNPAIYYWVGVEGCFISILINSTLCVSMPRKSWNWTYTNNLMLHVLRSFGWSLKLSNLKLEETIVRKYYFFK